MTSLKEIQGPGIGVYRYFIPGGRFLLAVPHWGVSSELPREPTITVELWDLGLPGSPRPLEPILVVSTTVAMLDNSSEEHFDYRNMYLRGPLIRVQGDVVRVALCTLTRSAKPLS